MDQITHSPCVSLELQPCCGSMTGVGLYEYEILRRLGPGVLGFEGNVFNFLGRHDHSALYQAMPFPVREHRLVPYSAFRLSQLFIPLRYYSLFPAAGGHVCFNYVVPRRLEGKVITVVHDMTYKRFPQTMKERNRIRLESGMAHTFRRSDHIITISEFSKSEIASLAGIAPERISVVPCAASLCEGEADISALREKHGIDGPYILCMGTVEPRKNPVRLIRAFEMLKRERGIPHRLVFAGGAGWKTADIFEAAGSSPFYDSMIFTGYVTQQEKNALYKNAAMLCFPSLYEGFGMPPLEAMTLGCPVVCSREASLPEVTGGCAEYVDAYDEADIARGIYRVLSDTDCARTLTEKGLARARDFSWERSAQMFTEICRKVLADT